LWCVATLCSGTTFYWSGSLGCVGCIAKSELYNITYLFPEQKIYVPKFLLSSEQSTIKFKFGPGYYHIL